MVPNAEGDKYTSARAAWAWVSALSGAPEVRRIMAFICLDGCWAIILLSFNQLEGPETQLLVVRRELANGFL